MAQLFSLPGKRSGMFTLNGNSSFKRLFLLLEHALQDCWSTKMGPAGKSGSQKNSLLLNAADSTAESLLLGVGLGSPSQSVNSQKMGDLKQCSQKATYSWSFVAFFFQTAFSLRQTFCPSPGDPGSNRSPSRLNCVIFCITEFYKLISHRAKECCQMCGQFFGYFTDSIRTTETLRT